MPTENRPPSIHGQARGCLMLTGPTGIGKTELAIALARRFPMEIISADSMQVYRGMAIGTAQPTQRERSQATFHLCGVIEPDQPFNAARFLKLCDEAHARIAAAGHAPLYVGGTGLYLRALRWGLMEKGEPKVELRRQLEERLRTEGIEALHKELAARDPQAAARISPTDGVRIVRALEIIESTGQPLSLLQTQWDQPRARFPHILAILDTPRDVLRERIALRTAAMLKGGWVEEVKALLHSGVPAASHCFKAIGYREIIEFLAGQIERDALHDRIVHATCQFAKRQMTWFRKEREATWIQHDPQRPEATLLQLEKLLEKLGISHV